MKQPTPRQHTAWYEQQAAGPRPCSDCGEDAVVWLRSPDGALNPGGYLCQRHADTIVTEYREKLGEIWTLEILEVT